MTLDTLDHAALSDRDLLLEVRRLVQHEREATAQLIVALAELDERKLYLAAGCSSLFAYCTQVLHLSEHAAYGRIEAARTARKWPVVVDLLTNGSLHLTALTIVSRHLTNDNHQVLLAAARHKTKREVGELVAALRPQPGVPSTVRKLPDAKQSVDGDEAPRAASKDNAPSLAPTLQTATRKPEASTLVAAPPARPAEITPLAPERYRVQFTASRDTYDKLREARDVLRHRIPSGDIALIFDRALSILLSELHRTKHAATNHSRKRQPLEARGRHIPASVKREVWDRDEGRCAFVGTSGRCRERAFLEYHHAVPFAEGGASTPDNLQLRRRAHNAYEAERWFGVLIP